MACPSLVQESLFVYNNAAIRGSRYIHSIGQNSIQILIIIII